MCTRWFNLYLPYTALLKWTCIWSIPVFFHGMHRENCTFTFTFCYFVCLWFWRFSTSSLSIISLSVGESKSKVKCTLVQALRLCTDCMAHRGSRSIALPFHDHSTRREWGVSVTPHLLFTSGKDPVSIVQEAGWAPGPVWTGAENLDPTGIRSLDHPSRSQLL